VSLVGACGGRAPFGGGVGAAGSDGRGDAAAGRDGAVQDHESDVGGAAGGGAGGASYAVDGPPAKADAGLAPDADPPSATSCPTLSQTDAAPARCRFSSAPSTTCSVAPVPIDAAKLCPGAASCPVTAELELRCEGLTLTGTSMVARGADGVSILTGELDTGGQHILNLSTVVPLGTSRVERVPALMDLDWAKLAVDGAGARSLFVGSAAGLSRAKETSGEWLREDIGRPASGHSVTFWEGRMLDDARGAAFLGDVFDTTGALALRDAEGWHLTPVGGPLTTGLFTVGIDLDATGRLWMAAAGSSKLVLVAPGGAQHVVAAPYEDVGAAKVLVGGLTGNSSWPALVFGKVDGLHAMIAETGTPTWSERLLPGTSPEMVERGDCPNEGTVACPGVSCSSHQETALQYFGFARTTAGRAYVAWLERDVDQTFQLIPPPTPCFKNPAQGTCNTCQVEKILSWRTYTSLVVTRLDPSPSVPVATQRFTIHEGLDEPQELTMIARENTLAVAVLIGGGPVELLYLELDSTKLP
jgi:hypothetical protein